MTYSLAGQATAVRVTGDPDDDPSAPLRAGLGLIYMNARFYVPGIARFASADTIVSDPTNPQNFNRYSYVNNNPLKFTDPTGHYAANVNGATDHCYGQYDCQNSYTPSSEDAVYPKGFDDAGEYILPPDRKIGVGIELSGHAGTPPADINFNVGRELVYDPITNRYFE